MESVFYEFETLKFNIMTSERIKEIQQETAYPNSISVQQALLKVWNECEQERVKIMGKYYYQTTPKRKRCKTKCKYANIFVGSVECRDLCKNHNRYGKDENGKYVECAACE